MDDYVLKILEHYDFDNIVDSGAYIRAACKIHDGDNPSSFVINKESGLWFCHSHCGGGNIISLIKHFENVSAEDAETMARASFNVNEDAIKKKQYVRDAKEYIKIMKQSEPQEVLLQYDDSSYKRVKSYRMFEERTLRHFKTHCSKLFTVNNYTYENKLIFPIQQGGNIVALALRRTTPEDKKKWLFCPPGISIANTLYNHNETKTEVVISEGILDVMAWYEIGVHAVATFGSHLTKQQCNLLLKSAYEVTLAYDGDKAGRTATKKAIEMLRNKVGIYVVTFDEGDDPESINRGELKKLYELRKRV
jgi:DNA primase